MGSMTVHVEAVRILVAMLVPWSRSRSIMLDYGGRPFRQTLLRSRAQHTSSFVEANRSQRWEGKFAYVHFLVASSLMSELFQPKTEHEAYFERSYGTADDRNLELAEDNQENCKVGQEHICHNAEHLRRSINWMLVCNYMHVVAEQPTLGTMSLSQNLDIA
jgi:hypothetical protein